MTSPKVVVTLQVASEASSAKTVEDLPTRTLILDEQNPTAPIGRASKESSKGFVAADNNAWFLSPVVSRKHAELVANFDEKKVYIRDIGATHGTFINTMQEGSSDRKLEKCGQLHEITDGTQVTLGVMIARNSENFYPTSMRVSIRHNPQSQARNSGQITAPGSTYAAPEYVDDCSSDEEAEEKVDNSENDEEEEEQQEQQEERETAPALPLPKIMEGIKENIVDLTTDSDSHLQRGHANKVIDLTTPAHSPASPPTSIAINPSGALNAIRDACSDYYRQSGTQCPQDEDEDMVAPKTGKEEASDDDSFFADEDDGGYSDLDLASNSSESELTDNFSMDTDSEPHSGADDAMDNESADGDLRKRSGYDAQYSADEDVLDENDPDTVLWRHDEGSECDSLCGDSLIPAAYQPAKYRVWEPTVDTRVPQPLAPPRQSIPVAQLVNPTIQSDSVESDVFLNANSKLPEHEVPNAIILGSSVGVPGDRPVGPGYRGSMHDYVPRPTGNAFHDTSAVAAWKPILRNTSYAHILRPPMPAELTSTAGAAVMHANGSEVDNEDDDDMPLSAHDLRQKKRMVQIARANEETRKNSFAPEQQSDEPRPSNMRIADILKGGTEASVRARLAATTANTTAVTKGKRKLQDISGLTEEEQIWEASLIGKIAEASDTLAPLASHWLFEPAAQIITDTAKTPVAASVPVPSSSEKAPAAAELAATAKTQAISLPTQMSVSTLPQTSTLAQPPAVTVQAPTAIQVPAAIQTPAAVPAEPYFNERQTAKRQKIRHIAERLGYAALGGVSVGAAIVTTLICTAPTF